MPECLSQLKHPTFHVKGSVNKEKGVLNLGRPMLTPSALPQVLLSRTDRTRSALSVTCLARDGKRTFFGEGLESLFLVRYSCSFSYSSPRPYLILPVSLCIRALFVRMFVPPGPLGGYLGCILGRLGSLLGRLEAVLGQLGALLGRLGASWARLNCLGVHIGPSWALLETISRPSWAPLGPSCWSMLGRLEAFEERYEDEVE